MERVVLVNEQDEMLGTMEKMEAHEKGLLHRAFSVFLFNENDELLLQRRASHKYHSGGLWTNTCCSHPRENEPIEKAGVRRLQEEMGITADVDRVFSFIYRAELDNELTEHEFDHVLFGRYDGAPVPNPDEVDAWKYVSMEALHEDIQKSPEQYTAWFRIIFDRVMTHRMS